MGLHWRYELKAETKVQPSKKAFVEGMKSSLAKMKADQRDALLTEIYRMVIFKNFLEWYAETGREQVRRDTPRFRKYRLWLADVDEKLSTAMRAMHDTADAMNNYPRQNSEEEIEKLILNKTGTAIARSGNALEKAIDLVRHLQYVLAAGIHPEKRTSAERRLVPTKPKGLAHTSLPLSERTRQIDLWFMRQVASILDKYRTKDHTPIKSYDQIIEHVFSAAFGVAKSPVSIRRQLSPSRRRKPRRLF